MISPTWLPPVFQKNPFAVICIILIMACGFLAGQWVTATEKFNQCSENAAQIERQCSERIEKIYQSQIQQQEKVRELERLFESIKKEK